MGIRVNKLISILIVLAFISTSTNLNYISSYISNDKDALRSMSANKAVAGDLKQALIAAPALQALLGVPSTKTSSAGDLTDVTAKLKQILKNPDLKPPVRMLIDSLSVWIQENSGQKNKNHILQRAELDKRIDEIEGLLEEIELDIQTPGTGHLPELAIISDYHGEINLFLKYVADIISQKIGKKIELDHKIFPQQSLKEQLAAQGVDIAQIDITFFLLGDFLDRGAYGVKCFRLAEEMINLGIAKYVTGNHDLWAFLNVMGFHLPAYKGYNFYGQAKSEQLVTDHWSDSEIADNRIAWWTDNLAEYNASQQELQKDLLLTYRGKKKTANVIREDLKAVYLTIEHMLTEQEKKLWQDLVGYYFGTTDVYTGFRAVGMMSAQWWKNKVQALDRIIETSLEYQSPESVATEIWYQVKEYTDQAALVVQTRLDDAIAQGEWWYQVFNDINHQNYVSVEWWGKDWSSHKGWGTSVIDELNLLENNGVWNQANYVENQHLKDLAMFYRKNFTLYQKDSYGNVYTHGWLPINMETGRISFQYKGVTYEDRDVWNGLEAIQNDVRDLSKPLSELHEALSLVNSWYADKTTKIKPDHIKAYLQEVGLEKIYSKLGIRCWFTCHNPLNKLASKGISFKTQQDLLLHFSVDKGMSYKKFKDLGAYTRVSSEGIFLRGFASSSFQRIIDSPPTVTLQKDEEFGYVARKRFPNEPLDRENFLVAMREQLREELSRLRGISPEKAIETIKVIVSRLENRFKAEEQPSGVQKTIAQLDVLKQVLTPRIETKASRSSSAGKTPAQVKLTLDIASNYVSNITDPRQITPDKMRNIKGIISDQVDALDKLTTGDILVKEKIRKKAEHMIRVMNLSSEPAELVKNDVKVQGILNDASEERIGGIVIDDMAMDISDTQRKVLLELYGSKSLIREVLEEKLNVDIILHSEYVASKHKKPNMIAIANRDIRNMQRITVVVHNASDSFMPTANTLILAQLLLLHNNDRSNVAVSNQISGIYYKITKSPMTDAIMEDFMLTGVFELNLPPAIPVNKNYYAVLEKIAAYTLIAA